MIDRAKLAHAKMLLENASGLSQATRILKVAFGLSKSAARRLAVQVFPSDKK